MISHWNLQECIPPNGSTTGIARVSFEKPDGEVPGPAVVKITTDGHVTFQIQIENWSIPPEYHGFLLPFLEGETPGPGDNGKSVFVYRGTQRITKVEVDTAEGMFRANRALIGNTHFQWPCNQNTSITVVPNDLQFIRSAGKTPQIWCIPLFGALSQFEGAETTCSVADHVPYISFSADGASCGLEVLRALGDSPASYTAVAFGVIGDRPTNTVSEVQELLPSGLFTALSFADGSDIRGPWIDLRSFDGCLQRRFHLRMGMNQQEDGFPAFTRFDTARAGSGLAAFLDCYFSQTLEQRLSLIPPLSLIRAGTPGGATVDESIADLVKALDALCKTHRLTHQRLIARLDPQNAAAVEEILDQAREALKGLRKQAQMDQQLDQLAVFDKIMSRQANVALEDRDFGLAMADLMEKFDLLDADVMNTYYRNATSDLTWEGLLSYVRDQVIHSAAIPVKESGGLLAWFEFARHLHDICKRVVLRQIGYTGTYAATNVLYTGQYEVDGVKASMTEKQLGYSSPPIPLH